jgi:hypothetical protein
MARYNKRLESDAFLHAPMNRMLFSVPGRMQESAAQPRRSEIPPKFTLMRVDDVLLK